MKPNIILLAAVSMAASPFAAGQNPDAATDWKPATSNQKGKDYPQVNSEGRARYRISAPQAQSISVGATTLTKGEDGFWTGVSQPMDEGFHYYHLTIDGGTFNDPGALNFYGSTRWESGIYIAGYHVPFSGIAASYCIICPSPETIYSIILGTTGNK